MEEIKSGPPHHDVKVSSSPLQLTLLAWFQRKKRVLAPRPPRLRFRASSLVSLVPLLPWQSAAPRVPPRRPAHPHSALPATAAARRWTAPRADRPSNPPTQTQMSGSTPSRANPAHLWSRVCSSTARFLVSPLGFGVFELHATRFQKRGHHATSQLQRQGGVRAPQPSAPACNRSRTL